MDSGAYETGDRQIQILTIRTKFLTGTVDTTRFLTQHVSKFCDSQMWMFAILRTISNLITELSAVGRGGRKRQRGIEGGVRGGGGGVEGEGGGRKEKCARGGRRGEGRGKWSGGGG